MVAESMATNVGLNDVFVILHRGSDCTFMIFNVENANIKSIVNICFGIGSFA